MTFALIVALVVLVIGIELAGLAANRRHERRRVQRMLSLRDMYRMNRNLVEASSAGPDRDFFQSVKLSFEDAIDPAWDAALSIVGDHDLAEEIVVAAFLALVDKKLAELQSSSDYAFSEKDRADVVSKVQMLAREAMAENPRRSLPRAVLRKELEQRLGRLRSA